MIMKITLLNAHFEIKKKKNYLIKIFFIHKKGEFFTCCNNVFKI